MNLEPTDWLDKPSLHLLVPELLVYAATLSVLCASGVPNSADYTHSHSKCFSKVIYPALCFSQKDIEKISYYLGPTMVTQGNLIFRFLLISTKTLSKTRSHSHASGARM